MSSGSIIFPTASTSALSRLSSLTHSPSTLSAMRHTVLSLLLILVLTSGLSQACFIRNCPTGGKRAMDSMVVAQRRCMSCGPQNIGQCVGPRTCCSPYFGCHIGTSETEVCQQENESTTPCNVVGDKCGQNKNGHCVANGICCDGEACTIVDECDAVFKNNSGTKGRILKLLERILQSRNLD